MTGMNNAVIFHPYFSDDYIPMLDAITPRHKAYCAKWGFDFDPVDFRKPFSNADMDLVQLDMVIYTNQLLKRYNYVAWLDLDTLIWDMETDLREATDEIGAVRFNAINPIATGDLSTYHFGYKNNHFNCGCVYIKRTPFTLDFVDEWVGLARNLPSWYSAQNAFNILAIQYDLPDLDIRWNYNRNRHGKCENPVVRGYHGYRGIPNKMNALNADLRALKNGK